MCFSTDCHVLAPMLLDAASPAMCRRAACALCSVMPHGRSDTMIVAVAFHEPSDMPCLLSVLALQVGAITGSKILRIMKGLGLAPEIPEDLYHLIKKAVSMRKHLELNRKDKDGKFRLILVESRIHRLARYYKVLQRLLLLSCTLRMCSSRHLVTAAPSWSSTPSQASL